MMGMLRPLSTAAAIASATYITKGGRGWGLKEGVCGKAGCTTAMRQHIDGPTSASAAAKAFY